MCDKIAKHARSQEESEGGREGRFHLAISAFPLFYAAADGSYGHGQNAGSPPTCHVLSPV